MRAGRELDPRAEGYPRLAPDLVAEVASLSQGRSETGAKAQRWLGAGVRLVWIVLPESHTVEVWRGEGLVRTLSTDEELSGEEDLPGLVFLVKGLFP